MIADLTMIATLPVDEVAVQRAIGEEQSDVETVQAQQPEPPHAPPVLPNSPEQPIVPPDDPHRHSLITCACAVTQVS